MTQSADALRAQILDLVAAYHDVAFAEREFTPGKTQVPVSGRCFDADEIRHLVDASLDFWLTTGRFAARFEQELARHVGVRHALLVNSGSSANLVAFSCLTSPTLGDRALRPGQEVITVAAGFPTTVNPIIQNGLVPVFVDVAVPGYDVDVSQLEAAVSDRTRAVIIAHTLGNPFRVDEVRAFCDRHGLWLIEDCCDALGSTYQGRHVGTLGDLATLSFYPAHHITMGEGGAVLTDRPVLKKLVESFRDWGRDCWCDPGKSNTCGSRFGWQAGQLPCGYDHKYIYSNIGYNLKVTDLQAAIGLAQTEKMEDFIAARRRNFQSLYQGLQAHEEHLILPTTDPRANPSPFAFPITVRPGLERNRLIGHLEDAQIETRLVFGGNIIRQPGFLDIEKRIHGDLAASDTIMRDTFFIGVYPGLTEEMIGYVLETFRNFFRASRSPATEIQRAASVVKLAAAPEAQCRPARGQVTLS